MTAHSRVTPLPARAAAVAREKLDAFAGRGTFGNARTWFGDTGLDRLAQPGVTAADWLRDPLDVRVPCSHTAHWVTLHPDNTVTFHDHPITDYDTEVMLAALAGTLLPNCARLFGVFTGHHEATSDPNNSFVRLCRTIITARAWAQPDAPEVSDDDRRTLIDHLVAPSRGNRRPARATGPAGRDPDRIHLTGRIPRG